MKLIGEKGKFLSIAETLTSLACRLKVESCSAKMQKLEKIKCHNTTSWRIIDMSAHMVENVQEKLYDQIFVLQIDIGKNRINGIPSIH